MGGPGFDLVIFDCDGVLVDSERLIVEIDVAVLAEMGWLLTPDEVVRRFVGRPEEQMTIELSEYLGRELPADWDAPYASRYFEALERLEAIPGIESALDRITLPTCVASSGTHEKMRMTLGRTGLFERFDGRIFSTTEVARGKPAPDLFLHAAAKMGAEPARCAVVEDSVAGVRAAQAAGMAPFAFSGSVTSDAELRATGARVFANMADLPDLLAGPVAGGRS